MIVVDASVAVKWFLNEQNSRQALGLFQQPYKLVAPPLIRLEVLAAIAKRVRMGQLAAQDAADQMERWRSTLLDRAVFVVDADDQYHEEAALSLQERHSIYDCVYLVLAKRLRVPLATADERLTELAQAIGIETFNWRLEQ
jgi:predicted nucleic acid-binding protein